MNSVSVRDLRNHGGEALTRVSRGEELLVTSDGTPVAKLVPLPSAAPHPTALVAQWKALPPMSLDSLRADLDDVLDATL
ncbi:MAG: type II toxin-antitoxin system prevent-host-death family antitoxin [Propionibacteriaceae bacterium]|nr:type II toxin-antitoxin system prevent-host-death family antitoxin [Propionibacteriaceae bacterium]